MGLIRNSIISACLGAAFLALLPAAAQAAVAYSSQWWLEPWLEREESPELSRGKILQMVQILEKSPIGRKIIQLAKKRDQKFLNRVAVGNSSLTETVFSRTYSIASNEDIIETENFLKLNRYLTRKDAILDFGHELTHFLFRRPANPYSESHSLSEFIREGIEGRGGELDAFEMECYVSWDLEKILGLPEHELCRKYKGADLHGRVKFSRELARKDYYRVGRYFGTLEKLQKLFPELDPKPVIFSSSLQKAPYPFALVEEFAFVRKTACENNLKKARLLEEQSQSLKGRAPASVIERLLLEHEKLDTYSRMNCPHSLTQSGMQHN